MTGYGDNFVTGFVSGGKQMLTSNNLNYNNSGGQNITWNRTSATDGSPAYWNNPYFERYKTTKMILEIVS
jgi:hypothetical protein